MRVPCKVDSSPVALALGRTDRSGIQYATSHSEPSRVALVSAGSSTRWLYLGKGNGEMG